MRCQLYNQAAFMSERGKGQGLEAVQGNRGRMGALRDPLPCWAVFTGPHLLGRQALGLLLSTTTVASTWATSRRRLCGGLEQASYSRRCAPRTSEGRDRDGVRELRDLQLRKC